MDEFSTKLDGPEVVRLMRKHRKTIAGLAFALGITQKRIREVRAEGLDDGHAKRDWLQAITGRDPGPLPERYRLSGRAEEGDCCYCGCPLFSGEYAYEYAGGMYCSVACCRNSAGFGEA